MVGFEQITGRAQTARGDCLELLREIPPGSVDMVLTDLPYGNTNAPWDVRIDEHALFKEFWRVDKGNAAVALFGQFPFACDLIAAEKEGRRFIGIELDDGFYEIAKSRIKEAARQPGLFDEKRDTEEREPVQQSLEICT